MVAQRMFIWSRLSSPRASRPRRGQRVCWDWWSPGCAVMLSCAAQIPELRVFRREHALACAWASVCCEEGRIRVASATCCVSSVSRIVAGKSWGC